MRNENKETNQGKKAIGESMGSRIVLALIVVAVIVTAAKVIPLVRNRVQTSQYPVIELADLQGMELESLSDGKFSFSYPAEDWEVWEQVTTDYHPLTIFYKGTADDGSTSISVAENDTVVTQLKPELLQVMLDGLKEQAPYMVIKESEMRSMEGTPVFYLEDNMSLTQEGLDMMVDTGAWTEETIEAMGGREALLSNNIASDQIQIYQLKNGKIYVYTGNYTDDEFDKLIDQARMLFDQDLADNNSKDDYKKSVETSIADYKNRSFKIRQTNVCDSDDVKYLTDDSNGDKLAYVTASYFTEENKKFDKTYQMYVLRKDDNGDWKIRTFYKIKGNSTEEE